MSDQPPQDKSALDTRREKMFQRAQANNVPLKTIFVTILSVVAVYALAKLLYRLRDILLLMLVGSFIALILNPLVDGLQRWKVPRRGFAVALITFASMVAFITLAFVFGDPLVNSLTHLANTLPTYVSKAQHGKGWIGHLLTRYHIQHWFEQNSSKLIPLANGLSKPALALGKGAVSISLLAVTMFAFVVLVLLEAPKIRATLLSMMQPAHAARLVRVSEQVSEAALGYVVGSLVISLLGGLVVFVTLAFLHVPFALLFGLWVALVDFLPSIGGALAGFPTVLFALGHSLTAGVVTLVVFLVYLVIQNHVLNPIIMSKAVKLNPLTVFISILVGAEVGSWVGGIFGGFVGVLLAIPVAATIQVIIKEFWSPAHPVVGTEHTNSPHQG
ncbi:MAG: AI-2E family transporter [Acidimicrobiales bacterium]